MRLLLILIAGFFVTAPSFAQSPCCRLDVSSWPNTTEIEVAVTNLGAAKARVIRMGPEFDLRIQIRGEDGRFPQLTEHGKQVRSLRARGSVAVDTIGKGQTATKQTLDLRKFFELKKERYTVIVSRDVMLGERTIELQGNATTITVP